MICAGIHSREGWKCHDAIKRGHIDFVAVIPPLPADMKAVKWDEIEWIHGISSFYPWDGKTILRELFGILAPGGRLVLEQPHFANLHSVDEIFGAAAAFKEPLLMNRWAYTPGSLTQELIEAGFSSISVLPAQFHKPERDFRVEAHRALVI